MVDAKISGSKSAEREVALARRRKFAAEMRAKGYKRKLVWVVDTERPGFAEECHRQSLAIAEHERLWRLEHPEAPQGDNLAAWDVPGWVGQDE